MFALRFHLQPYVCFCCSRSSRVDSFSFINHSSASGGTGLVARDTNGAVLFSQWKTLATCASAEEAEVMAMLEGIRFLAANPQQAGIIETDCARVVSVLNSTEKDRSGHWSLYLEAKALLGVLVEVSEQDCSGEQWSCA